MILNSCTDFSGKHEQIKVYKSSSRYSENYRAPERVAALIPMSGKNSSIGKEILNSCLLAIDNYKNVEMIVLDSNLITSNPYGIVDLMRRNNVHYVIGPVFSADTVKMSNISENQIYFSLSNNTAISGRNIVICGISAENEVKGLFENVINSGNKKILALVPKNAYGNSVSKIIDNLNTKSSYIRKVRYSEYSDEIIFNQLNDTNFDAIFVCEPRKNVPPIDGIPYMIPYSVLGNKNSVDKVIWASPDISSLNKFKKYFQANFRKTPSNIALVGYDVANIVFSACASEKPLAAVIGKRYHGVLGDFFIRNGTIVRKWPVYEK